jgi:hypothetical protein
LLEINAKSVKIVQNDIRQGDIIMNKLFKNIGRSVQILAIICAVIGLGGIIAGIILCFTTDELIGAIVIVAGAVLIITSLPIYAFGQITCDVREIKENMLGATAVTFDDLPEL